MPPSESPKQRRNPPWDPTKRLQLVCDAEQKRLWEIAAVVEGRTLSAFARYYLDIAANEAIRQSRQHPVSQKVREKAQLRRA